MARWATTIEVAGVSLTGCRGLILDGNNFGSSYRGSVDWANDGTPYPQFVNVGVKGIAFGLSLTSTEASDLTAILTAIQTSEAARGTFRVHLVDGLYNIDVNAVADYSQQQWLTHGRESEGWIEEVTFRFISVSAH